MAYMLFRWLGKRTLFSLKENLLRNIILPLSFALVEHCDIILTWPGDINFE